MFASLASSFLTKSQHKNAVSSFCGKEGAKSSLKWHRVVSDASHHLVIKKCALGYLGLLCLGAAVSACQTIALMRHVRQEIDPAIQVGSFIGATGVLLVMGYSSFHVIQPIKPSKPSTPQTAYVEVPLSQFYFIYPGDSYKIPGLNEHFTRSVSLYPLSLNPSFLV